jgi:hypothetical protein
MSRTKDLWMEQHEAAISRFVTGEDDAALFATAIAERAEQAAHEASVAYFDRFIAGDRQ